MKTGAKKTYFPWSMMVLAEITHKTANPLPLE